MLPPFPKFTNHNFRNIKTKNRRILKTLQAKCFRKKVRRRKKNAIAAIELVVRLEGQIDMEK